MKQLFRAYGRFVARRPLIALGMVVAITVLAIVGFGLTAPQADENDAFLPEESELVAASESLGRAFPESSALEAVQVVLRGDVLTPAGASESLRATSTAARTPELAPFVVEGRPPTSPGALVAAMLAGPGGDPASIDFATVTQADIDAELNDPNNVSRIRALQNVVARDTDGNVVGGIGVITVNANEDPLGLVEAQLAADDAVKALDLETLDARTLSNGKTNQESEDSSASSLALLMGLAFVVIAALLVLFYRQVTDVALSLGGLILTIVWALGFQGLLGPDGLGIIGAPSVLGQMVPVMMIGLCVDYGIQGTSRYREATIAGADPEEGMSEAVAAVLLPLGLAGATTIISFLTNLFGDIPGLADFGVVAGVGVASGLFIFLTGVPAARVLLDQRRVAQGKPLETKPINEAIPGAGPLVGGVGALAVRKPAAILLGTAIVTVVLGSLIVHLETSFNSTDFLPDGTDSKDDVVFLQEFLGGNTEPVTVLIEADITNDRTLRNMLDFSTALEDPVQRPDAVASNVTQSLGVVFDGLGPEPLLELDAIIQSSQNSPLVLEPEVVQASLDVIEAADPEGFRSVVAYGDGTSEDRTIVQFDALTGDSERTRRLFADVDGLWLGDDTEITPIANEIIALEVTDSLTDSQATSIVLTIIAALVVLLIFFWATEFRPMLAVLSVFPILLVLIWVLGTMVILGYSYNVITALITALSIGIGVDYTIHITHRFLEEREHGAPDIASAIDTTMRTTGGALVGSSLTTALGFAVLTFSPIPPMGQFGLLTAITVAYSLVAAIVVLPPMLVIWAAYHDWRAANQTALERVQRS